MKFIKPGDKFTSYMIFPKFLMDTDLSETEKLIFMILLDRTRLSQENGDAWIDDSGAVFVIFTIEALAEASRKSKTTVKTALTRLEKADLIKRKHQGYCKPNRIYVKLPEDSFLAVRWTENSHTKGQNSGFGMDRNPAPNNKDLTIKTNNNEISMDSSPKTVFGPFKNVFLSESDLELLKAEVPDYQNYINKLSTYMRSKNKTYPDHCATILSWAQKDSPVTRYAVYNEEETL